MDSRQTFGCMSSGSVRAVRVSHTPHAARERAPHVRCTSCQYVLYTYVYTYTHTHIRVVLIPGNVRVRFDYAMCLDHVGEEERIYA